MDRQREYRTPDEKEQLLVIERGEQKNKRKKPETTGRSVRATCSANQAAGRK